jgi:uncharacterized protein
MGRVSEFWKAADRTAVLFLGLIAGFAIGLSFNAAGRQQVAGWINPAAPLPVGTQPPPADANPAATQPAPELVAPASAPVLRRVGTDGTVRVGVFGDSFGDGLWAALYRQLPAKERYKVYRLSKNATGFTRYRTLDLTQRARQQVRDQPIDVAVISFGANDIQPIFAEGHLQLMLGDGWKRIIGGRIESFVKEVRATGATVFWVGLPIMRDPELDANVQQLNAFYAQKARELGIPFIETRSQSVDANGRWNAHLIDPKDGQPHLMRTGDGVHMTIIGYERLTKGLSGRIRDFAELARRQAGAPAPEPSPTPRAQGQGG